MAEEPFTVISLTPDDTESPDAATLLAQLEQELAAAPDADLLVVAEEPPPPIGKSWAFDFHRDGGRFQSGSSRGPLTVNGVATLVGWIEKCLMTARGAHPIHPPGYGLEMPVFAIGRHLHDDGTLGERIRGALTFHDRIADVRDVIVDYDPDQEYIDVSFTVVLDDSTVLPMQHVRIG